MVDWLMGGKRLMLDGLMMGLKVGNPVVGLEEEEATEPSFIRIVDRILWSDLMILFSLEEERNMKEMKPSSDHPKTGSSNIAICQPLDHSPISPK